MCIRDSLYTGRESAWTDSRRRHDRRLRDGVPFRSLASGRAVPHAVSRSIDPVRMAAAFSSAVRAGRSALQAGPMTVQELAVPNTLEIGRPFSTAS